MNVHPDDGRLFYKLFSALLGYVNRKLESFRSSSPNRDEYTSLPPQTRGKVRDALYAHRELIDQFVAENPAGLSPEELEIVASWKHALVGRFYILRYLKKYTIFLSATDKPYKAYGVLGLADPIEEVVGPACRSWRTPCFCRSRGRSSTTASLLRTRSTLGEAFAGT